MNLGILVINSETGAVVGPMARRNGRWRWPGVDAELDRAPADGQRFRNLVARHVRPAFEGAGSLERAAGEPVYDPATGAVTQRIERYDPPAPSAEAVAAARRTEIDARLAQIDRLCIRPLRAVAAGVDVPADHDRLAAIEAEVATLRAERAGIGG